MTEIRKCKTGAFGTWSRRLFPYFSSRSQVISVLTAKLFSEDKMEQDYIFQFFIGCFEELVPEPSKYVLANFKEALKKGDKRFYDALDPDGPPSTYSEALKKELDEFKECPQQEASAGPPESDDVPF